METIKKEQEEEEVKECTFRPQINSKSLKMVAERQAILRASGGGPVAGRAARGAWAGCLCLEALQLSSELVLQGGWS